MISLNTIKAHKAQLLLIGFAIAVAVIVPVACDHEKLAPAPPQKATFASPAEAGQKLAAAAKSGDASAVSQVVGPDAQQLLSSGDPAIDKEDVSDFAVKYARMNRWKKLNDGTQVLVVGADNFEFPIPVAQDASGKWYFDAAKGATEIKARNIGRNELLAIDATQAIANAEEEYFQNSGNKNEYAQRVISTPGKQDGLYWETKDGEDFSPLGPLHKFPKSSFALFPPTEPPAIDGYSLRILTAQGDKAKGGAKSYIKDGKMTGGFAVIATPLKYRETGVKTFLLNRDGVVYEKDLGPNTVEMASAMKDFNPSEGWTPVE